MSRKLEPLRYLSLLLSLGLLAACGDDASPEEDAAPNDGGEGDNADDAGTGGDGDNSGGGMAATGACDNPDLTLRSGGEGMPFVGTFDARLSETADNPAFGGDPDPDTAADILGERNISVTDGPVRVQLPEGVRGLLVIAESGGRSTNLVLANDDGSEVQLTDPDPARVKSSLLPYNESTAYEGTCLQVSPEVLGSLVGEDMEVHVLAKANVGDNQALPVDAVIVGDTDFSEEDVRDVVRRASEIYADNGAPELRIRNVVNQDGMSTVLETGEEVQRLSGLSYGDDPMAVTILFFQAFGGSDASAGTLGIAGGIPGPSGVRSASSAVLLSLDAHRNADTDQVDRAFVSSTLAHELAHQLGLFHTSEGDGQNFDPIGDTEECPDQTAEDCRELDGRNLMFYEAAGDPSMQPQRQLSATQVMILNAHPLAL